MKTSKLIGRMLFMGAFIWGAIMQTFAQKVLPEITVTELRYKYLNAVNPEETAQPVNMLEQYAADYDVKGAKFYEDEYDHYFVSFYIPQGKILAVYSKDGNLLRTIEKYNNVALPGVVNQAVAKQYPTWAISEGVYVVTYRENGGDATTKIYKLLLEKGDMRKKVKINQKGEIQ
ncbi:MAG TPA: nicotinate-nucleotide adenylyltransferase [Cyclobacteriaceae bacterium]|nr:nicotinate-nucleotide adenylyltransferase [Cyclobacteriaceae bacterium]